MLLIVNADDFGYTPGVNRGIVAAARCGVVRSVSLLPNQPGTAAALALVREGLLAGVGLGVHLCLTKGRPVSPPAAVPSLVGPGGAFKSRRELSAAPLVQHEVEREFCVQIQVLQSRGAKITHLDTHHHIHAHPVILEALIAVARDRRLPVRHLDPAMRDRFRRAGIVTTEHFCGSWFAVHATAEAFREFVAEGLRRGLRSMELMSHPGLADSELRRLSGYTREREAELAALCNPALREWLAEKGVQLGTYAELPDES
ncbi:MAG: carbohydrate deacetylase [Bacillota bacterium]